MTFFEFDTKFPTEKAVIDCFFQIRYHNELVCPHCGAKVKVYKGQKRAKVCHCRNCDNSFSPFSDTIFEKSSTDMREWLYAIHLVLNDKKGVSSYQLEREIGVTHKTAWRMLGLIREAMGNAEMKEAFECFVEIDETYVGGKPRKGNLRLDANGNPIPRPKSKRGRGTNKTPAVGVKERGANKVYAKVMPPGVEGKKLSGKQLYAILDCVCKEGAAVASDDFKSCGILDRKAEKKFVHVTVDHSPGQFSAGNGVHTNDIEKFWSLVKRHFMGTRRHYSVKHMRGYIDEMSFRQGHRKDEGIFDTLLGRRVKRVA